MYRAKCGLKLPCDIGKAKSYMVVMETITPLLDENGNPKKKINPPSDCDPKCLRKRRPHIINQLGKKDIIPVVSYRCRFTRVEEGL